MKVYKFIRLNSPKHWHMKTEPKSLKFPCVVTHGAGAYALGEVFRLFLFPEERG